MKNTKHLTEIGTENEAGELINTSTATSLLEKSRLNAKQKSKGVGPVKTAASTDSGAQEKSFSTRNELILSKLKRLSEKIDIPYAELQWWLAALQEQFKDTPAQEFESIAIKCIHLAYTYALDPLLGHVHAWQDAQSHWQWQIAISLDGMLTLINRHPQFNGLTITESTTEDESALAWVECCIYRKDYAIPICYREYATEAAQESDIWQKMPRRMLKNKAIQQCARIAFGFGSPIINVAETRMEKNTIPPLSKGPQFSMTRTANQSPAAQTERLKAHLSNLPR